MNLIRSLTVLFIVFTQAAIALTSDQLTLEEKVGQLLMVHFNGETANDNARAMINDLHVGGIIYYNWANGLTSPSQVLTLSRELQKLAKHTRTQIPLLIATDQEGGRVVRIAGLTIFPGNEALGKTGNTQLAEQSAFTIGQELKAVGVNMNLAPVVDVNNNPLNIVIGSRSFSDDPAIVCSFGEAALRGFHRAGIITCLKHFPGYGDVTVDPHETLPVVNKTREELDNIELLPFSKLAMHSDCIMTAHMLVPALDPEFCSTLSKKTLDILRNNMNFTGVIISDSLIMEGVIKCTPSVEEAAIQAFLAGCDIILLGGKLLQGTQGGRELDFEGVKSIHKALVSAVRSGRISEERLRFSVDKILLLKNKYFL